MLPADLLLSHFDQITLIEPKFGKIPLNDDKAMSFAIYHGFPAPGAVTGFTVGLSHFHSPGGSHHELTISMLDDDEAWVFALGFVAYQLRGQCPFLFGETIDFKESISLKSEMSAFVITHPAHLRAGNCAVNIGIRQINLVELVPIYQHEREWLMAGGTFEGLLGKNPRKILMNPNRASLIPK